MKYSFYLYVVHYRPQFMIIRVILHCAPLSSRISGVPGLDPLVFSPH